MKKPESLGKSELFNQNEATIKEQIIKFNEEMKQVEAISKQNGTYSPEFMLQYEEFFLQLFEKNDSNNFNLLKKVLDSVRQTLMHKVINLCDKISQSNQENLLNLSDINSEISSIISLFKSEVEIIIGIPVPSFLMNSYIQDIEETVKTYHKVQISSIIAQDEKESCWKERCQMFLNNIHYKKVKIFDAEVIGKNYINIMKTIISMIQNCKTSFSNYNYSDFFDLNINIIQLLNFPKEEKEPLIDNFINYASDQSNKQTRKQNFKRASDEYHNLVDNLNGDIRMFIAFCVLLSLSNAFQNGKIVSTIYPPINREIARKFLTSLAKFDPKSKKFYNFYKLIAFEGQLGEFIALTNDIQKIEQVHIPPQFLKYYKFSSLDLLHELSQLDKSINLNKKIFEMMNPGVQFDPKMTQNFTDIPNLLKVQELFSIQRISQNDTSKCAIICVSGFLSEGENEKEMWSAIVELFPDAQVFAIKYSSTTISDLVIGSIKDLTIHFYKLFLVPISYAFPNILPEITLIEQFNAATKNAIVTGKLLAICIALGIPLQYESISLVSFSLGTKVITTCARYLHKLNAHNKVHDMILIGGAASIDKKLEKFRSYFQVSNGKVMNCYSANDTTLSVLKHYKKITPIGTCPLECYTKSLTEKEIIDKGKCVKNICMTNLATGHLVYRSKLVNVVATIFNKYYFKFLSLFQ